MSPGVFFRFDRFSWLVEAARHPRRSVQAHDRFAALRRPSCLLSCRWLCGPLGPQGLLAAWSLRLRSGAVTKSVFRFAARWRWLCGGPSGLGSGPGYALQRMVLAAVPCLGPVFCPRFRFSSTTPQQSASGYRPARTTAPRIAPWPARAPSTGSARDKCEGRR